MDTVKFSGKKLVGTLDNYKILSQVHIFKQFPAHNMFSEGGDLFINMKWIEKFDKV